MSKQLLEMTFDESLTLELIKAGVAATLLLITWGLGQRILVSWDIRKKRQELDIAASEEFNSLYGDFKDIAKQWRVLTRNNDPSFKWPNFARWELFGRACAVESRNESLLVKLATERVFTQPQVRTLGLFRQAVQQLREAIRDGRPLASSSRGPDYVLFNMLAAEVAEIIASKHSMRRLPPDEARANLHAIASVTHRQYKNACEAFASENAALSDAEA